MTQKELNKLAQAAIGVTQDGDWGPISTAKSDAYEFKIIATKKPEVLRPLPVTDGEYFNATWIGSYIHLLGKHETDPELNAALVPEWAKEGLPNFKTLAGNDHAWCSNFANASFRKVA